MAEVQTRVSNELQPVQRVITNRYFARSPAHPSAWPANWNLSYELIPEAPRGSVVLLHGASDSPYSMRALAEVFYSAGLYVIVPRLPGHGTIPGELTAVRPADWTTVASMAVRHAEQQVGANMPLFIGGYSAGGAIALDYTLNALEDTELPRPSGILLFSPAVGVSGFAAFAPWDVLLSKFPGFAKFEWLGVVPEYDPFKYGSFPKQAGHLVYTIASRNQARIDALRGADQLSDFPNVIAFQSIVDATVSVSAALDLLEALPHEKMQLVLFDVNRSSAIAPFFRDDAAEVLARTANESWQDIDVTIIRNASTATPDVVASRRCRDDSKDCMVDAPLQASWPTGVFSLSHVAITFTPDDPLYGVDGDAPAGYNVGNIRALGERNLLVIPADDRNRMRYNPFFSYLRQRALAFCSVCVQPR